MRTRAQAAAEVVCLPNLSPDLLVSIAAHLPTIENVTILGATCRALHTISLDGSLWRYIAFTPTSGHRMTDARLRALLERVGARFHTVSISLRDCGMLDGSGLTPLAGSHVLRVVDLRRGRDFLLASPRYLSSEVKGMLAPMQGQLTSLLAFRSDHDAILIGTAATRGWPLGCSTCFDAFSSAEEVSVARLGYDECDSCNLRFCNSCSETLFADCEVCGRSVCYRCLATDYDGDYICTSCAASMPMDDFGYDGC